MSKYHYSARESTQLRQRIAREAARLLARKKVRNFHTARMRAMRWLSCGRVSSAEVPTQEEVMQELEALTFLGDWNPESQKPAQQLPGLLDSEDEQAGCEEPESEQWGIMFRPLLESLASFQWDYEIHPEADALYHSLQVYQLGREVHPYDEEFLWACLLHDVGYVVDPRLPCEAALRILQGRVTQRIEFLIGNLDHAHAYLQGTQLPKWLRREESVDELIDLARCDRDGRISGVSVPTLEEAIQELSDLSKAFG